MVRPVKVSPEASFAAFVMCNVSGNRPPLAGNGNLHGRRKGKPSISLPRDYGRPGHPVTANNRQPPAGVELKTLGIRHGRRGFLKDRLARQLIRRLLFYSWEAGISVAIQAPLRSLGRAASNRMREGDHPHRLKQYAASRAADLLPMQRQYCPCELMPELCGSMPRQSAAECIRAD